MITDGAAGSMMDEERGTGGGVHITVCEAYPPTHQPPLA